MQRGWFFRAIAKAWAPTSPIPQPDKSNRSKIVIVVAAVDCSKLLLSSFVNDSASAVSSTVSVSFSTSSTSSWSCSSASFSSSSPCFGCCCLDLFFLLLLFFFPLLRTSAFPLCFEATVRMAAASAATPTSPMPSFLAKSNDKGRGASAILSASTPVFSSPLGSWYRSTMPLARSRHADGPRPQTSNRMVGGHCLGSDTSFRRALFMARTPLPLLRLPLLLLSDPKLFQPRSRLCIETKAGLVVVIVVVVVVAAVAVAVVVSFPISELAASSISFSLPLPAIPLLVSELLSPGDGEISVSFETETAPVTFPSIVSVSSGGASSFSSSLNSSDTAMVSFVGPLSDTNSRSALASREDHWFRRAVSRTSVDGAAAAVAARSSSGTVDDSPSSRFREQRISEIFLPINDAVRSMSTTADSPVKASLSLLPLPLPLPSLCSVTVTSGSTSCFCSSSVPRMALARSDASHL
mmetsp:Transcript_8142/g.20178  ORF Transcript_8142/g.20178 Transcript_8142/m.20178 type:complete len:466 (-) Transcript_8142:384-1781(-)